MSVLSDTAHLIPNEPLKISVGKGKYFWVNPKISPTLNISLENAVKLFCGLKTSQEVAHLLGIPHGQLHYHLYPRQRGYKSFNIKKKTGGHRRIDSPGKSIKILQDKIKPLIEHYYKVKKPVHGFVSGKSILSNAEQHKKKKFVLNLDLTNFFGTINFGRVRGIFSKKPFNMGMNAATIIAQLCTYKGVLPHGASTSPVISNLAAASLDKSLIILAKKYHLTYTRYADDITFSSNKPFPLSMVERYISDNGVQICKVGGLLRENIEKSGFKVNDSKTRLQYKSDRQEVTGLVVNDCVNVDRRYIRNTRAMINSWSKGLIEAEKSYLIKTGKASPSKISSLMLDGSIFKSVVYGRLSFIKMIRGEDYSSYLSLCKKVISLDCLHPANILKLKDLFDMYDIFICHASEDKKEVAIPIYNALSEKGLKVFIDSTAIKWGDSLIEKINNGLITSKVFLAIISEKSIGKGWPMAELNNMLAMKISGGDKKILPLIVGDGDKIMKELPLLTQHKYEKFNDNVGEISDALFSFVRDES